MAAHGSRGEKKEVGGETATKSRLRKIQPEKMLAECLEFQKTRRSRSPCSASVAMISDE